MACGLGQNLRIFDKNDKNQGETMALRSIATVALLLTSMLAIAQQGMSLKSTELAPGLYMLDSADEQFVGGNMGLVVGDDGIILIDDGLEVIGPTLLAAIGELTGSPVDYVINTHYHGDHTGSNAALSEVGATIVAHENIRTRLADAEGEEAVPESALPTITYQEGINFYLNHLAVQVVHTPRAHTDGDSVLFFPDVNVIHTGDVLFNGMFPFIDLDGGGSVDGFLRALDRIIALADSDTKVIPGHGPLADRSDVQRARSVLADCQARVRAMVERGMSEADIVAANPLAGYHDDWNWDFITTERMTRTLYRSLTN